jgi:glutamyl-tRNA reductase
LGIVTLGFNHLSAPLDLRERLALPAERLPQALAGLRGVLPAAARQGAATRAASDPPPAVQPGAAIVSTCNRTEVYLSAPGQRNWQSELVRWLADEARVDARQLAAHAYFLQHDAAVRHAFRVASGLDSMVLGEPQILGQLKQAVRGADQVGALGPTLGRLFQSTFAVAKEVRSTTAIGEGAVSMAAACVRIAERIFENLSECKVLLVGAGEMIDLVGTHFGARHPKRLVLMNRSRERGDQLARKLHADYQPLADLPAQLPHFDIVVSCTASTLPIIGLGAVQRAIGARRNKPMLMVDLAVPRDIEADVAKLRDVYLYTVDDLHDWVREGVEQRRAAVSQAEAIIETRVADFMHWLRRRSAVPTIQALGERSEQWRAAEVERALRALKGGEPAAQVLDELARRLANKHLHGTLAALAQAEQPHEQQQLLDAVERFYLRPQRH